ncbi:MAG TPA: hypothetical protein VHC43_07695 [Mycobacteriales bacterium]|nr:hypothetical protein [Mycobacteriales bacterium]
MPARSVRTSLAVAIAAALLAACGSSSSGGTKGGTANESPAAELSSAIHALGSAHTLDLTLSLGSSGADLLQIASGLGGDGPTKAQADAIGNDHIGVELQAAPGETIRGSSTGTSTSGTAFAFTVGDDKRNYLTFESVGGSLYAQIDLRYFLPLVNGAPSIKSLERQVAGAPAFVRDALAGKWISLPAATLKSFEGLASGAAGATPSASRLSELRAKLLTTLLAHLQVARAQASAPNALNVTFNLRTLISDEYAAIGPMLSSLVPSAGALPALHATSIPDEPIHLDTTVVNGALEEVVLDAGQFDTKQRISVPIDLNIAQHGPTITAPTSYTPIDLSSIGQLFSGA